jgi:hypothetical protein
LNNKRNGLKTESTSNINTNSFTSEVDFINLLDEHYDNKGKDILIKIKSQLESIKQFGEKNPEFNNFSEQQRKELLNLSFIGYKKNLDLSKKMLLINNSELEINVSQNCMSSFNIDYNACQGYHAAASISVWLMVAFSGGTALPGAMAAQLGLELALWVCVDTATSHFLDCFNGAIIF